MSIKVTFAYGIVVRQSALAARGITKARVLEVFKADRPMAEDGELLAFGPSFGGEACKEFVRSLESRGLVYFDDFFDLTLSHPNWLIFSASCDGFPKTDHSQEQSIA
jgi:hypothetical protein